jgi:semaphorin 6
MNAMVDDLQRVHRKMAGMMHGRRLMRQIFAVLTVLQASPVYSVDWLRHHKPVQKTSYLLPDQELHNSSQLVRKKQDFLAEFHGNSSHTDHFKLLKEDGTSVLVGARNVIYNLSLPNLVEFTNERIYWSCSPLDKTNCDLKGKSESDCQNYIRVLSVIGPDRLLVCGTNCYNPLCRHYLHISGSYEVEEEFSGKGYAPYDPKHNSTSLYTNGHLYSATVADFSGTDPLIIKNGLRTEQYDYKHLNAPNFVSSLEDEEHVYFFFREAAVEYMNCGKSIFSRVARVCKSDEGGSHKFSNRWTTFLKSRMNCSVPGDYPFYFNEIQSTTNFFTDSRDNRVLYGVFTTPQNSILGSAICRFSLNDVEKSFESDFKNQETVNSNWLPLRPTKVPDPRPGRCYNQTTNLPESSLHFIKNHCLVDKAVQPRPSWPLFIKFGDNEVFTKIALHRHVSDLSGELFDVLFIGTNRGKVMKVVVSAESPDIDTSQLQEEIQIFDHTVPVLNLLIVAPDGPETRLIALSADSVKSIPVETCHQPDTCEACVQLSSPYCAWDISSLVCVPHDSSRNKTVLISKQIQCPPEPEPIILTTETPTTVQAIIEEETTLDIIYGDTIGTEEVVSPSPTPISSTASSTLVPPSSSTPCPTCQCNCPTIWPPSITEHNLGDMDNVSSSEVEEIEHLYVDDPIASPSIDREYIDIEPSQKLSDIHSEVSATVKEKKMSLKKVIIIIVATSLASLLLGFIGGVFVSRMCSIKSSASVTSSNVSLMKPSPLEK